MASVKSDIKELNQHPAAEKNSTINSKRGKYESLAECYKKEDEKLLLRSRSTME